MRRISLPHTLSLPGLLLAGVLALSAPVTSAATVEELEARVAAIREAHPGRAPLSGEAMTSKLGLLYLMGGIESQGYLDLADSGLLPLSKAGYHSANRGKRAKDANPDCIWVLASDCRLDPRGETPKAAADRVYAQKVEELGHLKEGWVEQVDFMEVTPVMWQPGDVFTGLWYSEFLCELLPRFSTLGPRPLVLNASVGNLPRPVDKAETLDAMVPGLRLAVHFGGAMGYQSYSCLYTKDIEVELSYALRYRPLYEYYRETAPEVATLSMILTEGGIDLHGTEDTDGWLPRGSLERFTDWLSWYDSELKRDNYVIGVALFKIGAPSIWKSFEMEPVVPWLHDHYRRMRGLPSLSGVASPATE